VAATSINISGNGGFGVSCEETAVLVVNATQDFGGGNDAGDLEVVLDPPSCFVKILPEIEFPLPGIAFP